MRRILHSILLLALIAPTVTFAADANNDDESDPAPSIEAPQAAATKFRPWDRVAVRLGGFAVRFDTNVRVDSETLGVGTQFDLEDQTNLRRNKTQARLDGHVRFGKRHRLDYGAVLFRRSSSNTIDEQIQFGDTIFDVDVDVATRFKNDVYKIAYRYDVVRRPRFDLGLSFGFSAFVIDVGLEATGAGGGMVSAETEDFVAPVPVIGIHADVKLAQKWYLRTGGEFFDVSVDGVKGNLSDIRLAVDWFPFKHFGFGAGYNRSRLTYEDVAAPTVDVSYTYAGAMVYASYVH